MGFRIDGNILVLILLLYMVINLVKVGLRLLRKKKTKWIEEGFRLVFLVYCLLLVSVTVFPIDFEVQRSFTATQSIPINYVPVIHTYQAFFQNENFSMMFQIKQALKNVGGNFILLLPLGILLPYRFKRLRNWKNLLGVVVLVSCGIEMTQLMESVYQIAYGRAVDIDDVILNVSGAMVGYGVYRIISTLFIIWRRRVQEKRRREGILH